MQKGKNKKLKDSSSKIIFGDATLCAQFLRNYIDIPELKNVQPEDIEDVSERFIPLFEMQREADTVKKIKLKEGESIYFLTLIEHKSDVDYNVIIQMFYYMCYIWMDYEKEVKKMQAVDITKRKDFKYPPILPIVYYEGKKKWTAVTNFKDRIFLSDVFAEYTPNFTYKLIHLNQYSNDELLAHKDEISLVMLINKLQSVADFKELRNIQGIDEELWKQTPEYLLEIIAQITRVLLARLNLPKEEVEEFVGRIKEQSMGELFEHFEGYDVQATRREAREEGREEGEVSGQIKGEEIGRVKEKVKTRVTLICKKLLKGKSIEEIADDLEETVEEIREIYDVVKNNAPEYDVEVICKEYLCDKR